MKVKHEHRWVAAPPERGVGERCLGCGVLRPGLNGILAQKQGADPFTDAEIADIASICDHGPLGHSYNDPRWLATVRAERKRAEIAETQLGEAIRAMRRATTPDTHYAMIQCIQTYDGRDTVDGVSRLSLETLCYCGHRLADHIPQDIQSCRNCRCLSFSKLVPVVKQ